MFKRVTTAFLLLTSLLVSAGLAYSFAAELTVIPSAGKLAGYVSAPEPGKWIVVQEGFLPVESTVLDGGKAVVWQGDPGVYGVMYFPPGDAQPTMKRVVLGSPSPGPGPGPGPSPNPPLPPGAKWLLLVEEAGKSPPQFGNLVIKLRKDPKISPLLWTVDKDSPEASVANLVKAVPATVTLPALVVVGSDGKPLKIESAPLDITKYQEYLK